MDKYSVTLQKMISCLKRHLGLRIFTKSEHYKTLYLRIAKVSLKSTFKRANLLNNANVRIEANR